MAPAGKKKLTAAFIRSLLHTRRPDSHKGTYGHALLVAGDAGKMGAAVIATRACLRSGAGLVTALVPADERLILQTAAPEAMLAFREDESFDWKNFTAIGIGPGLGTKDAAAILLHKVFKASQPVVIDADALNIIAQQKLLKLIPPKAIITPHPKEFDRLFGVHSSTAEREQKAVALSDEHDLVVVLKGHKTLIACNGEAFVNTTGNAGLAKGGSGDMLTGMMTALLAQSYNSLDASLAAVFLHGLSADIAIKQQSMESLLATDIIENIGAAFKKTFYK